MAEGSGHRQRLRQRFLAGEARALTDQALLELALTFAIPRTDVQPVAQRMLMVFGSLRGVLAADRAALCAVEGVGDNAATLLLLIGRLGVNHFERGTMVSAEPAGLDGGGSDHRCPPEAGRVESSEPTVLGEPLEPLPGERLIEATQSEEGSHQSMLIASSESRAALAVPEAAWLDGPEPVGANTRGEVEDLGAAQGANEQGAGTEDDEEGPRWRASGLYTAHNASKNGLLEETRLALLTLGRLDDRAAMRRELLDGALPQRSRTTRDIILRVITDRLLAWRPPAWVCADLVAGAARADGRDLCLLLLLHTARQDALLYDVVQEVIWPRWREGVTAVSRTDAQRFLDQALPAHPEIDRWSVATREKLAGNLLTILRDYGLLQGLRGSVTKRITEPVVSPWAAGHLARLLREEDVPSDELAEHPDWRLWLLDVSHTRALLVRVTQEEPAL